MMQRLVDNVLAVAKESVKTFTYESLNNIARLINGISALLLTFLPGKTSILQGIHGWELKPSFRGPHLPRWMDNGVSSFNEFIHHLSVDSDDSSSADYSSDGDYSDEDIYPASPSSHSSRVSRTSSFSRHDRRATHWIRFILLWLLLPAKILIGIPFYFFRILIRGGSRPSYTAESPQHSHIHSIKKAHGLKDHIIQRTTDRRRGIIEDLHVATEIIIESVFDVFHKAAHVVLSPLETFKILFGSHSYQRPIYDECSDGEPVASVPTATLGSNDTSPTERTTNFESMNTDARTCEDVITELGYPYEAIRVETSDGYVLLLERIPRRDSKKVVYLQHGIMDSSMGWVSNGVVGSPAFAAYDQGYDVYLGNFRGLVSREHVNKNISSRQYWNYSINEHATEDIPAIIDKIHQIKVSELGNSQTDSQEGTNDEQPYRLCAICHSLGGAAILMYIITHRMENLPHRISRLILLSPAGFHDDSSIMFTLAEYIFLWLAPLLALIIPAFYIPTRFFRMLLNKLARDFHNYPAVGGLVQTLMSYVVGGDSSNWVGVLGISHYNMNDMPGVSFRVAQHLAQIKHAKKFIMYDYGSPSANMRVYGSPEPIDLGEYYGLIEIPVDLVAGKKDKVIRPSMVKKHYRLMKNGGVEVSYNEYEYAHLDFTFSHHEELLAYVMSRLLLVGPLTKPSLRKKQITKEKLGTTSMQ
ncbi:unnamed protein product [Rhodiola kirilowii]